MKSGGMMRICVLFAWTTVVLASSLSAAEGKTAGEAARKSEAAWTKPNVVLIVIESLRKDHLGCYGYSRNTSPSID